MLKYRIKDVIEEAVSLVSKNTYKIDINTVSFSIKDASIQMRNTLLKSNSPQDSITRYGLTIPEFYIRLSSWKPLIFQKKIVIDSLHMADPVINIFEGTTRHTKYQHTAFNMSVIVKDLNNVLKELVIKKLTVENAAASYKFSDSSSAPLNVNNIDISILNFSDDNNDRNNFLSAEDIDIRIGKQHWVLPGSKNELDFSSLYFSGSKQLFEIDSCSFKTAATEKSNAVNIEAEKFLLNTTSLTSLYLENKLVLDTLVCSHPILHLETKSKIRGADTSHTLSESLKKIFTNLHFKYINIIDGQLYLLQKNNDKQTVYTTEKTDLRLYDLDINTTQSSSFSLGNIELNLDTIQFFTPDSLYVLNVDDFSIYNNDLVCKNAAFVPVKKSIENGGLQIILPRFVLKNIGLQELLQKKLKAEYAFFDQPKILVEGSGKRVSNDSIKKPSGVDGLYTALHSFNSLINVKEMYIQNGDLHFKTNGTAKASADVENLNAVIKLNDLFQSGALIDIKKALSQLSFDKIQFSSPNVKAVLEQVNIKGTLQQNSVKSATVKLVSGATINAGGISWEKLDWDLLYKNGNIYADIISFNNLQLQYKQVNSASKNKSKSTPALKVNNFSIGNLTASIALLNGTEIKTKGSKINLSGLSDTEKGLQWEDIKATLNNAEYTKQNTKLNVELAVLDKHNGTRIDHVDIVSNSGHFVLPEVRMLTAISNTSLSNLHFKYFIVNDPQVTIAASQKKEGQSKTFTMPFNISADMLQVDKAQVRYNSKPEDSLHFTTTASITIDSFKAQKQADEPIAYHSLKMSLTDLTMQNKKLTMSLPSADLHLTESILDTKEKKRLSLTTNIALQWMNAAIKIKDSSERVMRLANVSGNLNYPSFQIGAQKKVSLMSVAEKLNLSNANLYYAAASNTIGIDKINWDGAKGNIVLEKMQMMPNMQRDTFFKTSQWQKDYMKISFDKININNFDLTKYSKDTAIDIKEILVYGALLNTSRDKNIPFQHGIEKLMPTKLIAKIKIPLHIGSVQLKDASIVANEISMVTQREGSISLVSVNAEIKNITNRPGIYDSLTIRTNGVVFDHYLRSLQYKESYADSLSGFRMTMKMAPMNLTALTKVTNPLAAVNIEKGHSDTLIARVAGNKYAAFGEMKFYYKDLKVRMLDHKDTTRKNILLSFENMLANKLIVKTNNKKNSKIFFIRDPEKFVFNYWIKSTFSGVLTSAGVKRNKKYEKKYKGVKDKYSLPVVMD